MQHRVKRIDNCADIDRGGAGRIRIACVKDQLYRRRFACVQLLLEPWPDLDHDQRISAVDYLGDFALRLQHCDAMKYAGTVQMSDQFS